MPGWSRQGSTQIRWALRYTNDTLTCAQAVGLTESCPKNGDLPPVGNRPKDHSPPAVYSLSF